MNRILYVAPTVHVTPNDVYLMPFMTQNYSESGLSGGAWWPGDYGDEYGLIYAQSVNVNTTGQFMLIWHYMTDYPIMEIESSNAAMVRFNLTELYEYFGGNESYLEMMGNTQFTGFKLDSNVSVAYEFGMPEPKELWKTTPDGTMTKLTDWTYENGSVLLSFGPGVATISMIFGDNNTNYHNPIAFRQLGDVNGDGVIDGADIAQAAWSFGSYAPHYMYAESPAHPRWNQDDDINTDYVIDGSDLALIALHFGQAFP